MFRTTIVYESMFGATREVADAIARGMTESDGAAHVRVRRVGEVDASELVDSDLLIVGAPTHVHPLSRPTTRTEAEQRSRTPERHREPGALDAGMRELLDDLPETRAASIAFDTRAAGPEPGTGSAARSIGRMLAAKGSAPLLPRQTFLVDSRSRLTEDEAQRAAVLGRSLPTLLRGGAPGVAPV